MPHATLDGIGIFYEVSGAGHPVILLHGHALDSRMWQEQATALSGSYTIVRYDLRGHGRSQAPPSGYSRAHYAEELHQLAEYLGLSKPSVVGHSLGAGIALEYALRYPWRISSLALVSGGLEGLSFPEGLSEAVAKQRALLRQEGVSPKFLRAALISPLFDGVRRHPGKLALVKSMLSTWSGASWLDASPYPVPPRPHAERLGEVRAPVLVVVGEREAPSFHEVAEALSRAAPVVRKAVVPEAGHLAPLENPAAFNDILLDFLGGAVGKALL